MLLAELPALTHQPAACGLRPSSPSSPMESPHVPPGTHSRSLRVYAVMGTFPHEVPPDFPTHQQRWLVYKKGSEGGLKPWKVFTSYVKAEPYIDNEFYEVWTETRRCLP